MYLCANLTFSGTTLAMPTNVRTLHILCRAPTIASFPGPAQLSIACTGRGLVRGHTYHASRVTLFPGPFTPLVSHSGSNWARVKCWSTLKATPSRRCAHNPGWLTSGYFGYKRRIQNFIHIIFWKRPAEQPLILRVLLCLAVACVTLVLWRIQWER